MAGLPIGSVCGRVWSLDRAWFYCEDSALDVDRLHSMPKLESVTLRSVHLSSRKSVALPRAHEIKLEDVTMASPRAFHVFANARTLMLDRTAVPDTDLTTLQRLEVVSLNHVRPPAVVALLRLPRLTWVDVNWLECGSPSCTLAYGRELKRLRPRLTVRVEGVELE